MTSSRYRSMVLSRISCASHSRTMKYSVKTHALIKPTNYLTTLAIGDRETAQKSVLILRAQGSFGRCFHHFYLNNARIRCDKRGKHIFCSSEQQLTGRATEIRILVCKKFSFYFSPRDSMDKCDRERVSLSEEAASLPLNRVHRSNNQMRIMEFMCF